LVVAKVRERLANSNSPAQKMDMERFNPKKLNNGNVKQQYMVTIRNKSAALENLHYNRDFNKAFDIVRENIKFWPKSV
jgi:hypothetical protein